MFTFSKNHENVVLVFILLLFNFLFQACANTSASVQPNALSAKNADPVSNETVFLSDNNTIPILTDEKWVYDYCQVKALGDPDGKSTVWKQVKSLIGTRIVIQFDINREYILSYNCPYAEKNKWTKYGIKSQRYFQSGGPAWEATINANFPNTAEVRNYFCGNNNITRIKIEGLLSDVDYGNPRGEVICEATLDDCKILK